MENFNNQDLQVKIVENEGNYQLVTWFSSVIFSAQTVKECIEFSGTRECAQAYGIVDSERFMGR